MCAFFYYKHTTHERKNQRNTLWHIGRNILWHEPTWRYQPLQRRSDSKLSVGLPLWHCRHDSRNNNAGATEIIYHQSSRTKNTDMSWRSDGRIIVHSLYKLQLHGRWYCLHASICLPCDGCCHNGSNVSRKGTVR